MDETIKVGLGFVTGRPNVCKVINNTYEQLINQFKDSDKKVELTTKYDNKDVTIENIEYTGYSLSPTESDIGVHIIFICILIAIGLICWRIRKD